MTGVPALKTDPGLRLYLAPAPATRLRNKIDDRTESRMTGHDHSHSHGHSHPHGHAHGHSHGHAHGNQKRLLLTLMLAGGYMIAEIVGELP